MLRLHNTQPCRRRNVLVACLAFCSFFILLPAAAARTVPLDGKWKIAFDREHTWKGKDGSIDHNAMASAWREVSVPSVWELMEPDYDGVAWYRCRFRAPLSAPGERIRIRFHAVNYFAEVWLNSTRLGSHEGGYTPFEFEVSNLLKPGDANELLVRVLDPGIHERIDGFFLGGLDRSKKDLEIPQGKERRYGLNFGGIWQPVELIATGPAFLRDVFVIPRLSERSIEFRTQTDGDIAESTVEFSLVTLREPDTPLGRQVERLHFRSPEGTGYLHTLMMIDRPHPWSPDDPFLYQATVRLYDRGTLSDEARIRFGMREFTYRDGAFLLNGKRILLKGGLTQGFYPITLATPEYPQLIQEEIRLAKQANLNLLRLHLKPHAPEIYRCADELGILLYAETPIGWMTETRELRARCEREVREMILRDRNHPSVVMWGILNEGSKAASSLTMDLARLAQRLDPSRIIVPDSGQGETIVVPFQREPVTGFRNRHEFLRSPVDDPQFRRMSGTEGLVSQTGYGGLFDLPRVLTHYQIQQLRPDLLDYREYRRQLRAVEEGFRECGLAELFGSPRELLLATQTMEAEAARYQTDARRLSRELSGIIQCFVGNAWEHCGMLDVWRERKSCYASVAEAFQTNRLVAWSSLRNGYLGDPLPLEVYSVGEHPQPGKGYLVAQVVNANGDLLWEKAGEVELRDGVQPLLAVKPVINANQEGQFSLRARVERDGEPTASTQYDFHLLRRDRPPLPSTPIGTGSSTAEWEARAEELGVSLVVADPAAATPAILVFTGNNSIEEAIRYFPGVKEHGKTALLFLEGTPPEAESVPLVSGTTPEADLAWLYGLTAETSVGGAVGYFHYVRPHRVFERLPQRCLMGQPYRNLCARKSLVGKLPPGSEVIVGAFTTTRGEFRWRHAVDLAVIPYGSGRIILSTLELTPHLGQDSIVDAVFLNILRFAAGG